MKDPVNNGLHTYTAAFGMCTRLPRVNDAPRCRSHGAQASGDHEEHAL